MPEFDAEIISRLNRAVEKSGLTQAELAKLAGLQQSHVSRALRRESALSLEAYIRISRALNLSPADVLRGAAEPIAPATPLPLLDLLSQATPRQLSMIQEMLEQMVLAGVKRAGQAEARSSAKEIKRAPDKRGK